MSFRTRLSCCAFTKRYSVLFATEGYNFGKDFILYELEQYSTSKMIVDFEGSLLQSTNVGL